jgi:hypothetical protein
LTKEERETLPGYEASVWYGIAAPAMIALVLLTELAECPFLTPRWGNRPAFLYRILESKFSTLDLI